MMKKDDDIIPINDIISKIPKKYLTKGIKDTFGNITDYSIKGLTLKTNDVILNKINISDNKFINLKCSYKQDGITYFLVGVCKEKSETLAHNDKLGYVLLDTSKLKLIRYMNDENEIKNYKLFYDKTSWNYYMKNYIIRPVHK